MENVYCHLCALKNTHTGDTYRDYSGIATESFRYLPSTGVLCVCFTKDFQYMLTYLFVQSRYVEFCLMVNHIKLINIDTVA